MITFDRLKLAAPISVVSEIKEEMFEIRVRNGIISSLQYKNGSRPKLMMSLNYGNYGKGEFVIEFTR